MFESSSDGADARMMRSTSRIPKYWIARIDVVPRNARVLSSERPWPPACEKEQSAPRRCRSSSRESSVEPAAVLPDIGLEAALGSFDLAAGLYVGSVRYASCIALHAEAMSVCTRDDSYEGREECDDRAEISHKDGGVRISNRADALGRLPYAHLDRNLLLQSKGQFLSTRVIVPCDTSRGRFQN